MSQRKQYLVGAGQPSLDDVMHIVNGLEVVIDSAAADRCKKDSPPPKSFVAEEPTEINSSEASRQDLDENLVRAILFFKLVSLVNGKSKTRVAVMQALASLLNTKALTSLPAGSRDHATLAALAAVLKSSGDAAEVLAKSGVQAPQLSISERAAIEDGQSAAGGVGAVVVQSTRALIAAANAVAALSAEALQADVKSFDAAATENQPLKSAAGVADTLRAMFEGSRQVNGKKAGVGAHPAITLIPVTHGAVIDSLTTAGTAVKAELATPAPPPGKDDSPQLLGSPALTTALISLASTLLRSARLSRERTALLCERITAASAASTTDEGHLAGKVVAHLSQTRSADGAYIQNIQQQLAEVMVDEASGASPPPSLAAALTAYDAVSNLQNTLSTEAFLALVSLRLQEDALNTPAAPVETTTEAANGATTENSANNKKKDKKNKGGPVGMLLGKGTSVLRSALESAALGITPSKAAASENPSVDALTAKLDLISLHDDAGESSAACGKVYDVLKPLGHELALVMSSITAIIEANQAHRKPKIAKGTRDFLPDQMAIRDVAFRKITNVFKRHGAVSIDTPVFELRETLMGKYGEDSKLIYDLADQGGEILSLRYDLTVPFARYVAIHGITNIKRYHIAKVYRRDQPQMNRGRFREFYQCDFDIAGSYATMVADSEVLKVLVEILSDLQLGEFEIKLNHRKLLDAMMAIAGVPSQKFRPICSAIDKLDKEPWEDVRAEMVEEKGLPGSVADKIGEFVVLRDRPRELLAVLMEASHPLAQHPDSAAALQELKLLFDYLDRMGALAPIVFDLSLARGLDYYTGVIYEAVLKGANVGSIAAGGRYDTLVGMFSGKEVPAVGVSIGIERVFSIMEGQLRAKAEAEDSTIRETETEVLVASIGNGMQEKRMELAAKLWSAGIKAEFGFKPNPKMGDQLGYALKAGIPFMVLFGDDELARGVVKVKDMDAETEDFVEDAQLVDDLKRRVAAIGDRHIVARKQKEGESK